MKINEVDFKMGIKQAFPITLGYFPLGFAFGVMGREAGLQVSEIVMMSMLVFAGAAQFIAVSLLNTGVHPGTIIATTFLVNLRHMLMSTSLQPKLKHFPVLYLAGISFEITDETFVVASNYYSEHQASLPFHLGLNVTSHLAWVLSSWLGASLGTLITEPEKLGLNFALPAMFIALLASQIKNKTTLLVALLSGIISLAAHSYLQGNWHIILATIGAATIGVLLEKWMIN